MRVAPLLLALALAPAPPLAAEVRDGTTKTVSEDAEPIGAGSGPIGEYSRPVGEGSISIGEASLGPLRSGPVSDMNTRSMRSGPVSSLSRGPVRAGRGLSGGGSMTENSAGAIKHDAAAPLGTRISAPLRELGALQDQLRRLRVEGDAAALEAAAAPVAAEPWDDWDAWDWQVDAGAAQHDDALSAPADQQWHDALAPDGAPAPDRSADADPAPAAAAAPPAGAPVIILPSGGRLHTPDLP